MPRRARSMALVLALVLHLVLTPLLIVHAGSGGDALRIASPDGMLELEFANQRFPAGAEDVKPCYRVSYQGRTLVDFSPLGLAVRGGDSAWILDRGFRVVDAQTSCSDRTWAFAFGKASSIGDNYRELTVLLQQEAHPGRELHLVFRVYDEGVALRYFLPSQGKTADFAIAEERTSFYFTGDHRVFAQKHLSFRTSYDQPYKPMRLHDIQTTSLIGLPMLIQVEDGPWMALSEADLTDYAGMYLSAEGGRVKNCLRAKLSPKPGEPGVKVAGRMPFSTPWRVIMVGEAIGDLIESNLILNLNDPCALEDTSWIKPGKAAWPWWSGGSVAGESFKGGMNTATMLHYIDFAAEARLQYLVIDAGWYGNMFTGDITKPIAAVDMPKIVNYARERGISVILWLHWLRASKQMDQAFPLYERWGIAGVKVDYMRRDDQDMVRFYHETLRKAAAHHLVVDFHGGYKPTGIRRTYPNLLTQEAVRGLEYNKWTNWCDPEHDVMLAFTRLLAGEMDYTPGGFRNATRAEFRPKYHEPFTLGTRCHQLAMFVIYESPLQMVSDHPAAYRGETGLEFIKDVPTVWDETRVVLAEVGDLIVIARRKGAEWYLGGMTDWTPREVEIPLGFLGDGEYTAEIYADGGDADDKPRSVRVARETVTRASRMKIRMAAGGGVAMQIIPRPGEDAEEHF